MGTTLYICHRICMDADTPKQLFHLCAATISIIQTSEFVNMGNIDRKKPLALPQSTFSLLTTSSANIIYTYIFIVHTLVNHQRNCLNDLYVSKLSEKAPVCHTAVWEIFTLRNMRV